LEHTVRTPFGNTYRFDVALLASAQGPILAAIEFELKNRVPAWKLAMCTTLGFPIITIGLQEMTEDQITKEWILKTLTETTLSNEEGRRRNFFFLHSILWPIYASIPPAVRKNERRHTYLVFAADKDLEVLAEGLLHLRKKLKLQNNIHLHIHQSRNEETQREMAQDGAMAGHDWAEYNDHRYLRIILDIPLEKSGPIYLYHLIMSGRLTSQIECLVGYKPTTESWNFDPFDPLWRHRVLDQAGKYVDRKILPKHLFYPLRVLKQYWKLVETDQRSSLLNLQQSSLK